MTVGWIFEGDRDRFLAATEPPFHATPLVPGFRWELQPNRGTSILCGAVVPMYTQAGGGVEVCFDTGATNIGPIADQLIIPPL
jgi:hypothetical protein